MRNLLLAGSLLKSHCGRRSIEELTRAGDYIVYVQSPDTPDSARQWSSNFIDRIDTYRDGNLGRHTSRVKFYPRPINAAIFVSNPSLRIGISGV